MQGVGRGGLLPGRRVKFFAAAGLLNRLEEVQKTTPTQSALDQFDRTELLICDELGRLSFSRAGHMLVLREPFSCSVYSGDLNSPYDRQTPNSIFRGRILPILRRCSPVRGELQLLHREFPRNESRHLRKGKPRKNRRQFNERHRTIDSQV